MHLNNKNVCTVVQMFVLLCSNSMNVISFVKLYGYVSLPLCPRVDGLTLLSLLFYNPKSD